MRRKTGLRLRRRADWIYVCVDQFYLCIAFHAIETMSGVTKGYDREVLWTTTEQGRATVQ